MRARWVLLGGLLLIGAMLAQSFSRTEMRWASFTDVQAKVEVGRVAPGARACQADEHLAQSTRALRVGGWVEGAGGARVGVELDGRSGGPPRAVAETPAQVTLPLSDGPQGGGPAEVCLVNAGPGTLVLAGTQTGPEHQIALVDAAGRRSRGTGRIRLEAFVSERPASLWSVLGDLPGRVATASGTVLAPWLAVGGLVVALAATVLLLWREDEGRDPDE